jgi:hypothetical protein
MVFLANLNICVNREENSAQDNNNNANANRTLIIRSPFARLKIEPSRTINGVTLALELKMCCKLQLRNFLRRVEIIW